MPDDANAAARLGQTLRGKYRLDAVLGVGGWAPSTRPHIATRKRFAVKVLHAQFSNIEQVRMRFLREGYVANSVAHRGAVSVLDDDVSEDGSAFLVMELLQGSRLPAAKVADIGVQLLDVLASAHANGIVHRDLTPANMFLTSTGELKVLDFGIARLREATSQASPVATQTRLTMGTPAFTAPEQALGRSAQIDAQSDSWAAGATPFTLCSGEHVHTGSTGQEMLLNAATRPSRLAPLAPNISPAMAAVIDRAISYDKRNRWPDAAAMRFVHADVLDPVWRESGSGRMRGAPVS